MLDLNIMSKKNTTNRWEKFYVWKKMAIALRHQAMKILYTTYWRCYSPFYCPEVFSSAYLHWSVKQQIGDFKPFPFYKRDC